MECVASVVVAVIFRQFAEPVVVDRLNVAGSRAAVEWARLKAVVEWLTALGSRVDVPGADESVHWSAGWERMLPALDS